MLEPHLVDAVRFVLVAPVAHIIDKENANAGECQKCLACAVYVNGAQRY